MPMDALSLLIKPDMALSWAAAFRLLGDTEKVSCNKDDIGVQFIYLLDKLAVLDTRCCFRYGYPKSESSLFRKGQKRVRNL